jgi:polyisoprenoid-binding protein YceI
MKKYIFISLVLFTSSIINCQKYFTKDGKIHFEASSPIEKIEASNSKATSVIDLTSGAIEWSVLMKGFTFEKALMQEHFNENYVESTKYPKAIFKGKLSSSSQLKFDKDGVYTADVNGTLDLHGISRTVKAKVTFNVKGSKISANSTFKILLADYGITIPSLVKDKISKETEIKVEANYLLLK